MTATTRQKILQRCYEAICEHGFVSLRTDKEIKRLRITKGAFYHYFPGKLDLGYAVIEEILLPMYMQKWESLENRSAGIARELYSLLEAEKNKATDQSVRRGDVLANLMLEMSHEDEQFRLKLEEVLEAQEKILQRAILAGKAAGEFKPQMDARSMAYSLIGSLQGCYAIAKTRNSKDVFTLMINALLKQLKEVLFVAVEETAPGQQAAGDNQRLTA
ncbi:MAG: TetR/AcrR family transcriptional regulator [Bacteroidetes bacterium]|nr:TetR/AcrR family transcriptional regulator [Bacteroidota bacterium]